MSSYAVISVPREDNLSTALELGAIQPQDAPDPELVALPRPPRRQRTFTLAILSLACVLAMAMAIALRHDVAYAVTSGSAASLGDLRTVSSDTLAANENRLVRAEALLGAAGGIRYERALSEDTFRALPVAGRRDVWVDVRVPAGQENGRWEPPRSLGGRLVRFDAAGPRHRGLASAIEQTTHESVASEAFLLVDGEDPAHVRWSVVLAAMFFGFAAYNALSIVRLVRRVKEN
jgi:hypothetical protein